MESDYDAKVLFMAICFGNLLGGVPAGRGGDGG